jgi:PKD repeat protein
MALAVCVGLPVFLTSAAGADSGSGPLVQATVYQAGGGTEPDSVTQAQLLATPSQCPLYTGGSLQEYGRQGPVTVTPSPTNSWSLGTILGCLQTPIAFAQVTGVTVIGDDGSPLTGPGSQLGPNDLAPSSDFADSSESPVVQALGSTDQYDRPWRGGSDLDYLDETQTTPIAIEVFEGPPLRVTASASQTTVTVGATIDFSAAVSGNNGSALSYTWSFDGGASSSDQPSPEIQFNTAGVWTVNVEVTDANGGGGGDQRTITVNPAGSTTSPTTTGKTTTGPDQGGGPTPGGNPVKQKKSGAPGRTHTHGKGSNQPTGSQTQTTSTTQTTTTQTTTTQTTTTPAAGSSGGSSGGGSSGAGSTSSPTTPAGATATHHRAPAAPSHRPSPLPSQAPSTLVSGQLVSDVVTLPADRSPLVHVLIAGSASAPARQAPEHPSPLGIIGAALGILALLGLGAQRELGRPRWWRLLHVSG